MLLIGLENEHNVLGNFPVKAGRCVLLRRCAVAWYCNLVGAES